MHNRITVSVLFSFKGKRFTPQMELDLDQHMQSSGYLPDLYLLLARSAEIDLYSYEYEVMQVEPLSFSQATGLAADYLHGTDFDIAGFEMAWKESQIKQKLAQIAKQELDIDDLSAHPLLQKALIKAYEQGKKEH